MAKSKVINAPVYSFATIALFLATMTVLIVTDHADDGGLLIGLGVSTLPSLVASLYSEQVSRDVRNGVLVDKVKEGATQALEETGTVTRDGPAMTLAMQSLATILNDVHTSVEANTQQRKEDNGT
jgi:hypothetical protein